MSDLKIGEYNQLRVIEFMPEGVVLDYPGQRIILPRKQVPAGTRPGDKLKVFIYRDNEKKIIATTKKPFATVGEVAFLEVVSTLDSGCFLDLGIDKDVFVPRSQLKNTAIVGEKKLVKILLDADERLIASERVEDFADNEILTVEEKETVRATILKQTDLGYNVLINGKHIGLMHFDDVFGHVKIGDTITAHIKRILTDNKLDIAEGKHGYKKIEDEFDVIMRLLDENNGFLPFHDKSEPEDIYAYFGMSKKAFKKVIGGLYKKGEIDIRDDGIFKKDQSG